MGSFLVLVVAIVGILGLSMIAFGINKGSSVFKQFQRPFLESSQSSQYLSKSDLLESSCESQKTYCPPLNNSNNFSNVTFMDSSNGHTIQSVCPKVYKYPLPEAFLSARILPRGHADTPFPDPFGPKLWPTTLGYYATKHKSAPSVFEYLLDAYGGLCKTDKMEEAQLFFIPWYRDYFCGVRPCNWYTKATKEEQQLFDVIQEHAVSTTGTNFFQRKKGRDHFMLVTSEAATALVPKDMKWFFGNYTNISTFSGGYGSVFAFPFATMARYEAGMDLKSLPWSYKDDVKRRLMFMSFGTPYGLRHGLNKQCIAAGADVCMNVVADRSNLMPVTNTTNDTYRAIVEGMKSSKFCIHVGGDFCSRRAFFDSMAMGCISVTFSHCPMEYYNDFIDMDRVVILLPVNFGSRNLVTHLESIPEWEVKHRQLYLAQNGHRIQMSLVRSPEEYNALPREAKQLVHEDAFFKTLRLAEENLRFSVACESLYNGFYQPRFYICCKKVDDDSCNPFKIVAGGVVNSCWAKGKAPCYFPNAKVYELVEHSRKADPLGYGDFLRGPIPFVRSEVPYTTDAGW